MGRRSRPAVVFLVTLLLTACVDQGSPDSGLCSSFPQFLPDYYPPAPPYTFQVHPDSNCDGQPDRGCVVFYHFAASPSGVEHSPVGAVYFESGCQGPACLQYGQFLTTNRDYLCENQCVPSEEDVLSQAGGNELVVRDLTAGVATRATVFRWLSTVQTCTTGLLNVSGIYVQTGHFVADRVTLQRDRVELDYRLPADDPLARSQIALRRIQTPRDAAAGGDWNSVEEGYVFYYGPPADVTRSLYPEVVVLGLYTYYTDTQRIRGYFTPSSWDLLKGCSAAQCGCTLPRDQVVHIQATLVFSHEWTLPEVGCQTQCDMPNHAIIGAYVACAGAGQVSSTNYASWTLIRQNDQWLLDGVSMPTATPRPGQAMPYISSTLAISVPSPTPTPVLCVSLTPTPFPPPTPLANSAMQCPMDAQGNLPPGLPREVIDYCMSLNPNPW